MIHLHSQLESPWKQPLCVYELGCFRKTLNLVGRFPPNVGSLISWAGVLTWMKKRQAELQHSSPSASESGQFSVAPKSLFIKIKATYKENVYWGAWSQRVRAHGHHDRAQGSRPAGTTKGLHPGPWTGGRETISYLGMAWAFETSKSTSVTHLLQQGHITFNKVTPPPTRSHDLLILSTAGQAPK